MTDHSITVANSWNDYRFPDWVPEAVCDLIRDFWRAEWGRSPKEWAKGAAASYNAHPPLGSLVDAESLTNSGLPRLRGRWVPTWNNMGCVVFDDGSYKCSSTCSIKAA